ncbi:T6SS phospholipase effector Tle1-like catalytic domain-containing protein [Miltoncostaea oceani]|uniref:T6SS phospholipase effector Tle1-like catalytic domain-containing protein n=1 Tax=Miltoncostaea oceani TaxID=2843216 RepID=UPI001C3C829A|nr:DUF2235 domain-containing protein [Miltoncostaea oceani]
MTTTPPAAEAAPKTPKARPGRRIVIGLDGTWNNAFKETQRLDGHTVLKPSNVLKLCRAVLPVDPVSGRTQITYYDVGVGGLASYPGFANQLLRRTDRFLGGIHGAGFEENAESALHFLALNLEKGDEVFIFGFSRGAATSRAVTRFIEWAGGLPTKDDSYYLPRLFREFVRSRATTKISTELDAINKDKPEEKRLRLAPVNVRLLGVFDTVMALGFRALARGSATSGKAQAFYAGERPATCVAHARQALAIDERRFDFRPEIWRAAHPHQTIEQRWFPGAHVNIGGGYTEDGLGNLALEWMLKEVAALKDGIAFDQEYLGFYRPWSGHPVNQSETVWYKIGDAARLRFGKGRRQLLKADQAVAAGQKLDKSVIRRMQLDPTDLTDTDEPYRPQNVIDHLARQPDLPAYIDQLKLDPKHPDLPPDVLERIEAARRA